MAFEEKPDRIVAGGIRSRRAVSYGARQGERAKWRVGWTVVYPLFMTKVWPDFTKAQARGRLKRAASVTRVAWGRPAEKLQAREGIALR